MLRRRLTIAIGCISVFLVAPPVESKNTAQSGYALEQIIRSVGKQNTFVCDNAIEIEQPGGTRATIMRPPDWRALVINHQNKTFFNADTKNGNGLVMQRMMMFEGGNLDAVKWTPVEETILAGIRASRYVDFRYAKNWKFNPKGFSQLDEEMRVNGFWAVKDAVISTKAADQLASIHGMPKIGRIPLQFVHRSLTLKHKIVVLDTLSCKKAQKQIANFVVPAGYKRSLSEFDASFKDSGMLDDIIPQTSAKGK